MKQTQHQTPQKILIIGAGAFGAALAAVALRPGLEISIIARNANKFPALQTHPILSACQYFTFDEFQGSYADFHLILIAIPCQSFREVCVRMKLHQQKRSDSRALWVVSTAKGLEEETLFLPHQIIESLWAPSEVFCAALSGPSFAKEMMAKLPTCVVVASSAPEILTRIQDCLHASYFRIYQSTDVVGVELCGAIKNVIAIIAGASDGLELGHNARAAVVTRGLGEIAELGLQLGANPVTFLGLSGVGDLLLTCTGSLSRNRQFGYRLAQGETTQEIIAACEGVVEGYATVQSAYHLAQRHHIQTSLLRAAYKVLYEGVKIPQILDELLKRTPHGEFDWNE